MHRETLPSFGSHSKCFLKDVWMFCMYLQREINVATSQFEHTSIVEGKFWGFDAVLDSVFGQKIQLRPRAALLRVKLLGM